MRRVDRLRDLLEATGTRVLQRDCPQRNLQGLFQHSSGTIVICRVHRDAAEIWNTLAHEATHRMQAGADGSLTRPEQREPMIRTLATYVPDEFRALRLYRPVEWLSELEARSTARLPPDQVISLYRRCCCAPRSGSLSGRMPGPGFGGSLPPRLGGGLPPGGGGDSAIPFQLRPQATVLRPSLEVATVAGVTSLERQGSLSAAERTTMLRSQGQLLGWPSDWDRSMGGATWSG